MKKVIILGGKGIAAIAAWIMDRRGDAEIVGLVNDKYSVGEYLGTKKKYRIIGKSDDIRRFINNTDYYFFVAFHGMEREEEVYNKVLSFEIPRERLYSPIDPEAIVSYDYSDIGSGVLVAPGAQIGPDVSIGDYSVILGNAYIGHDSTIGRFCHIAAGAIIGSYVYMGDACHIGLNATVKENVRINDFALIGMGSVVLNDVDSNTIEVGNPARLLRKK